jgi:signal transduction histidine kinase
MLQASNGDVTTCEYRLQRKNGNWEWIQQRMTILARTVDGKPSQVLVTLSIITERKHAENRLRQRSDELNALNVLGREVTASFSSGNATAVALSGIMNAIQPDLAYLFLRENEKLILKESQARNTKTVTASLPTHRVGECMCGLSVSENRAFYSRDIFVDWRCTWDDCKKAGLKSFAALPLRSGNEAFGVIGLASFAERDFEQQDEFLETLSSQISAALENARLFETIKSYASELETAVEERTRELREAQEKLIRNEKLAVLGQLAGGVGHELRNPLTVINNALYFLKLIGSDSSEKMKEYLGIIQAETHNAERIITDLLDFARIKSVDVEPVSASKLVERVLERYPAPKTVKVTLEFPDDLPTLYVDLRQTEQVLGNLVINACQAMSAGGELTITVHQEKEMIAIAVRDTGTGISPENMKKLFEPLFTTKAKGIGLGLAVSQKLTEANGGRIEVQSEAGVGSSFTLWLPANFH